MALWIMCLRSKHTDQSLEAQNPSKSCTDVVAACNPSPNEADRESPEQAGQLG